MARVRTEQFVPVEARYIKAARIYAQLSQPALAKKLGISKESMKRREARGKLKAAELLALPQICGVPAEFFQHGFAGATWPDVEVVGLGEGPDQLDGRDEPDR